VKRSLFMELFYELAVFLPGAWQEKLCGLSHLCGHRMQQRYLSVLWSLCKIRPDVDSTR
jgi:hypothetical protein